MNDLALSVGGYSYEGWQNVEITHSMEQLAQTFSVSFAERWNESGDPIPINEGDDVIVRIDRDEIIMGYVDDASISYDATSHTASVSGRALTGDLVDCAAIHRGGKWKNATLRTIANNLCDPFGIFVTVKGSVGNAFRSFAIQDSETGHETLERAARMRGVLLMTTADGQLLLTNTIGTRKVATALRRGENILRCSRTGSMRDRFSRYTIKAQIPGDDKQSGDDVTISRSVTDSRVRRYRPTILMAETEDSGRELKERVTWERNRRAGDARRVTYVVQGWRDDDGDLWEPNTLVNVDDDWARIKGQLLIVSVKYSRGLDGTTTELELAQKEAFELYDLPPPKPKKKGKDYFA